jgi:16S rRNA (cytosine967-C5)-methyltransferase
MTAERAMQNTRRSQSAATAKSVSLSARALALVALRRWRTSREFSDAIIQRALRQIELSAQDRAFAQELFYGVLRNLTLLDFWIDCLRPRQTEAELREILRLGLYQLFLLGAAEHAAVYETVELARKQQHSFINGVLRSALRQKEELSARAQAQPLAVRFSHPEFLVGRWESEFGRKPVSELCAWNNRAASLYARVNRMKLSVADFLRRHAGASILRNYESFVALPSIPTEALLRGDCYMQDPSTSLACRLIDPQPDERILDACAAPGGKSGYLAELMGNRGEIVACDRDADRVDRLRENLDRLGLTNIEVMEHDWRQGGISGRKFQKILLDVPCTNTGVMRRRVDVRWRLRPDDFARMHGQQMSIARAVIPSLKTGGVFVYSTCSLEREENEQSIEELSQEFPQLRLDATESVLPFRDDFDGAFAARFVWR